MCLRRLAASTVTAREEKCYDPRRCPPPEVAGAKKSVTAARRATGRRRKVLRRHGAQIVRRTIVRRAARRTSAHHTLPPRQNTLHSACGAPPACPRPGVGGQRGGSAARALWAGFGGSAPAAFWAHRARSRGERVCRLSRASRAPNTRLGASVVTCPPDRSRWS